MLFNKNLSINKLLVLGIAVCTVCASSNAMDNYGSSHSNNRTVNNYNNFSNSLNRSNIHAVGNKYKVSNPNYTIVRRDEHDIKVPTYSINRVSNRDRFTIRAQKDNTHEIFINTRDTNKKVNDIHNYFFRDGGSKKIDGTYDNSKKLIKGQYDLKNEVNKNNNDIKEFNKTMHNNLVNLENHISKLIRNNQNNHNELNKNINNNFLETTKNIYNNRAQQMEDNNKLQKIMYDNNNKQQKDIHEVANILTEKTLEINKNIHYSSEQQQKDSSAILAKTSEQTKTIINDANQRIENAYFKNLEEITNLKTAHYDNINKHLDERDAIMKKFNKVYDDMLNKLNDIRNEQAELDEQTSNTYQKMNNEYKELSKFTIDVLIQNKQDHNQQEILNTNIKYLSKYMEQINKNQTESNINNKLVEFLLEKLRNDEEQKKLEAMQQQNNLRQQQVLNYSNNNVINPNLQYYNPNIGSNNNYIHNYNNDNMINQNVGGDNNHIRNYNNNMFNYNNNMINLNNNLDINNYNNPINNNPNNINISNNRNPGNSFSVRDGEVISINDQAANRKNIYDYAKNINNSSSEHKIINANEIFEIEDPFDGKNPYDNDFQNIKEEMIIDKLYNSVSNIEKNKEVIEKIDMNNIAMSFNNIQQLREQNNLIEGIEHELQNINKHESSNNKVNNQNIIDVQEKNNIKANIRNNNEKTYKLAEELLNPKV